MGILSGAAIKTENTKNTWKGKEIISRFQNTCITRYHLIFVINGSGYPMNW